jgi:hypothetical protein
MSKDRLAGLYRDIFELDNRGQAIYEDLYKRFGASARVHTDGGIDAVLKTYKDAAQRGVIEYIIRMVNIGNGADDVHAGDE